MQRVIVLAEQTQHPAALVRVYLNLAITDLYTEQFDLEKAVEHGLKGAETVRGGGYWHLNLWGYSNILAGFAYIYQGDLTSALGITQELVRFGQDANDPDIWCVGLTGLGVVRERRGEFEESIVNLNKAIELAEAVPDHIYRLVAGYALANCYCRLGDLDRSLNILTETDNYRATYGVKGFNSGIAIAFLETYLAAAEQAVEGRKGEWLKKAKRACKEVLKLARINRLILPLAMRLQGKYEWLMGKPSFGQEWWQKSLNAAEEMGMRYDLGMTHLEMGRRIKDRAHLAQAEKIFFNIGANFDLAQTRKLLEADPMRG